jgi:hypothetical protein
LPAGNTKQLLTLTNTADVPMEFAWQFGVFEEQRAVISGRLSVVPTSGKCGTGMRDCIEQHDEQCSANKLKLVTCMSVCVTAAAAAPAQLHCHCKEPAQSQLIWQESSTNL